MKNNVSMQGRRRFLGVSGAALAMGSLPATLRPAVAASHYPAQALWTPATSGQFLASRRVAQQATLAPSFTVRVLTRIGFGPRPGDVDAFNALGANDTARLQSYLEQQLNPASIDDSELESKLASGDFTTLNKSLPQLWQDHVKADPEWQDRMRPLFETERATFLRAVYSRRQLVEVLADFWHTHFSVHGWKFEVGPVWVHYDRDVIRQHLLGNFRQMLEAVTKSTAMMYYLDNVYSSADGPNENYAREQLELHALGARNSYGFTSQDDVPEYSDGLKKGYTEQDVKALAQCLTGWTIQNGWQWPVHPNDNDNGEFLFRSDWHDSDRPKRVLGIDINGTGMAAAQQVFDLLARHPEVARYVCEKLCRRLISDQPPADVVDQAAAVFLDKRDEADQLTHVVRTVVMSDAFQSVWGEKIKRPFETVTSALRACDADITLRFDDDSGNWGNNGFWFDSGDFLWRFSLTGHRLFDWAPPNGYPDLKEDWSGSTPLVMTWQVLTGIVNHWGNAAGQHRLDIIGQTWAGLPNSDDHTPTQLVDFWTQRVLGYLPDAGQRAVLVGFMAQDGDPNQSLDINSDEWSPDDSLTYIAPRLRMMVSLVTMMPGIFNALALESLSCLH